MAIEPTSWSTLFDEDAIQVKPRERRVSNLLKSYRYGKANFGTAETVMLAHRIVMNKQAGMLPLEASNDAHVHGYDDAALAASEERAWAFCAEFPPAVRDAVYAEWKAIVANAASNQERMRD